MLYHRTKVTIKTVDLSSVVHHAVEMSAALLQDAGLRFTSSLPKTAIYLEADPARLTQVIGNILNNAAKFTPPGGAVSLAVALEGGEATIRVRDTGIGLTEESRVKVFDLFVQAASTVDRPEGLGIGLALAKSLVERHDGRITVSSDGLGKGTEFTIHLPVLTTPPESILPTHAPGPARPQVARRVLVVDDNHDSAHMLAILLDLFGHETRMAHDGVEAVEVALAFQPDVVLLDIGLPRQNGYEAANRFAPNRAPARRWSRSPAGARTTTAGNRPPPASTPTWSNRSITMSSPP